MLNLVRNAKNRLLPDEIKYYRPILGLFAGLELPLNLQYQFALYIGLHERPLHHFVRRYTKEDASCFDIGAASGEYMLAFARIASKGNVYAFEPNPQYYQSYAETISRNSKITASITPMNYFVGANHEPSENMVSIDGLVGEMNVRPPDILKIDVDGGEFEILSGARDTIHRYHPNLIIEVHSYELERQCTDLLTEYGYKIDIVDPESVLGWKEQRVSELNRWNCAVYQNPHN